MRKIMNKIMAAIVLACLYVMVTGYSAFASDGPTEYITISVEATDDNGNLQYAIGSPTNFSTNNTFTIPAGSSQTIYVKDAAGNITTREYSPTETTSSSGGNTTIVRSGTTTTENITAGEGDQEINIELELGMNSDSIGTGNSSAASGYSKDHANYEYLTDTVVAKEAPVTVQEKMTTNGTDLAEKVFYTIQTAEGETFYLVIEQGASNAVHLLNTVTLDDLEMIAAAGEESSGSTVEEEDNLLQALQTENSQNEGIEEAASKQSGSNSLMLIIFFFLLIGGGAYYYFFIHKNKKSNVADMDAMDMDEFVPEAEDDEDEELDFDEEEKQRLLDELIASEYADEELVNQDPDDYVQAEEEESNQREEAPSEAMEENSSNEEVADDEIAAALSAAEEYDEELDGEEE